MWSDDLGEQVKKKKDHHQIKASGQNTSNKDYDQNIINEDC